MSLTLATLLPGILLLALGAGLLSGRSSVKAALRAFPRSPAATVVLFGIGSIWFLGRVWHLSAADFGNYRVILFVAFALIALLAFKYVPDFLAVRGLAILILLAAAPLLEAGYMIYEPWTIYLYKVLVYLGIALALYLGAAPYRMRDFLEWLFRTAGRPRALGAALAAYGLLLIIAAFTY
jgi:hypothetical protein